MKDFNTYWNLKIAQHVKNKKIFLACSGGMDSVFLFYKLIENNIPFSVLHCNFKLRDKDSELDSEFVQNLAQKHSVPFKIKEFETSKILEEQGKGVQEVARNLRYNWFNEILDKNNDVLLTAHHLSDSIETSLFNFFRGTSIKGLTGIKNNLRTNTLRPLLYCTKQEIKEYLFSNKMEYREDISNQKNNYSRNRIRNKIIPEIKEIFPDAEKRIKQSISHLTELDVFIQAQLKNIREKCFEKKIYGFKINKDLLFKNQLTPHILKLLFLPFSSFSEADLQSLENLANGKKINGNPFNLILGRKHIYLYQKKQVNNLEEIVCEKELKETNITHYLPSDYCNFPDNLEIELDSSKIIFPISIRHKKDGDFFYPENFKGKKKLKNYFNELKLDIPEKEEVLLLTDKEKILWIIGYKKDRRALKNRETEKKLTIKIVQEQ